MPYEKKKNDYLWKLFLPQAKSFPLFEDVNEAIQVPTIYFLKQWTGRSQEISI